MKEIIRIQISKFLSNELVEQISQKQWHTTNPAFVNRSRQYVFDEITDGNDCFGVVALAAENKVIGRLHCVRNKDNIKKWYYGDLFVIPEYRRMGIATQMIEKAKSHLSEIGAQSLCCYVEPDNVASRQLQISVGFTERPFCTFNDFINDGEIMYELNIVNSFCIIPATVDEAYFVRILFVQNKEKLSVGNIDMNEWKEILTEASADTKHFLICKGAVPIAYIRIEKAEETDNTKISTFFVADGFDYEEIYNFGVEFAKNYVWEQKNIK